LANALNDSKSEVDTPCAIDAIKLLMFTGARRGEIIALRWDEVRLERNHLSLKTSKTGEKTIQLNSAAREILGAQQRMVGNEFVFPSSRNPGEHISIWDIRITWEHVRQKAKLDASGTMQAMRLHDLRHSFATYAAGTGLSLPMIGRLLGHKNPTTTQRYADIRNDPAQQAAEAVGVVILDAMNKTEV
jgi:integrase